MGSEGGAQGEASLPEGGSSSRGWVDVVDGRFLLLVEDNPDDVYLTLRELRRNRFPMPVRVITDGGDALAYVRGGKQKPAAVLLDLELPPVSGRELLAAIRGEPRLSDLPVIVVLSSVEECERLQDELAGEGADLCLVKPLRHGDLIKALEQVGAHPRRNPVS